jgi:RHS repeat-associated protein
MQNLIHSANNNGYTKNFEYDFSGNKLKSVSLGKIGNEHSFSYKYDKAGNLSNEGPTRCFVWDHNNRLKSFYIQTGDSPPSLMTSYLYDSNGTRVKKLVKKQGILDYDVSVYLDTMFEYHAKVQHKEVKEDNMIHILNDNNRIAIIRIGQSIHETGHLPDIQYVLGDHLSNSSMMIDDASSIVSVEEYYPFGETSFGNFARKRYRYAGKERDEENGFYYFGARYLAPWLARWTSCDPLFNEGTNLYMYVKNNPLILVDLHGTQSNTIHTKDGSTSKVNGNILGNESGTGQTFSAVAQTASTAAATAYGLVEWSIWNPGINLTRAQQFAIDSRRGFIFDELAGNNLGKNFPQADYVTDTVVGQTKSTRSTAAQTVRKITIKAAQDAQKAIAKNPDFIGKTAEARIVLPTGSKKETVAAARNALGGKSIAGQVKVSTGIPGVGGTILKGLGFVGAGASAYGLYQDYQQNNVASGIGNAASLASSGLSVAGAAVGSTVLAASGAVTGAFAMGYGVGSIINSVLPENAQMAIGETIFNTLELVGFQPKNW